MNTGHSILLLTGILHLSTCLSKVWPICITFCSLVVIHCLILHFSSTCLGGMIAFTFLLSTLSCYFKNVTFNYTFTWYSVLTTSTSHEIFFWSHTFNILKLTPLGRMDNDLTLLYLYQSWNYYLIIL